MVKRKKITILLGAGAAHRIELKGESLRKRNQ